MRLIVSLLALAVLAAAAPAALADYRLDDDSNTLLIGPDDQPSLAVEYTVFCNQQFACPATQSVGSSNGTTFTNDAATCNDASNGDRTRFDCDRRRNTRIEGTSGADSVKGSCFGVESLLVFAAGDGNDEVTAPTCGGGGIDLGAGDDVAAASGLVLGGAGNDVVRGGAGNDTLDGGDGRDTVAGEAGNDTVRGGPGRDLLIGGTGADLIEGGEGTDTASFEDRDAAHPVTLTLDGDINDGEPNEGDRIERDVENLIGGAGGDTLIGDANPNDIDGGDGGDVIDAGGGPDFVDAGAGNDRVFARDGAQDRIHCGDGNDLATVDAFDIVIACEDIQASRELMSDVDADGVPAPADCDDRDPVRRPGFIDRPGNGLDEDCTGADAPYARILSTVEHAFFVLRSRTRFTQLRVRVVPEGATIELRCTGGRRRGCFSGVQRFSSPRGHELRDIRRPLRGRQLRAGARLEVRILDADSIGKVVRYTMRSGERAPLRRTLCLVPGSSTPGACPR
jgi:Ca2+-binding RTX toxin-like protein